jgi:hypothetical protein
VWAAYICRAAAIFSAAHVAAESVELPDDEYVAWAQAGEHRGELRASDFAPEATLVNTLAHPAAVRASCGDAGVSHVRHMITVRLVRCCRRRAGR